VSLPAGQVPGPASISSTRRFCARPCGVSFGASGSASPAPRAETRFGWTPFEMRKSATAWARRSETLRQTNANRRRQSHEDFQSVTTEDEW
jgi:hypothetical protein